MKSFALILLFPSLLWAAPAPTDATTSGNATSAKSSTNVNFEDLLVQGKYHFSDEAVTTVEDDKVLDSLIGVRSDFKDRLKQSSGLY
jgi:hypothetical protein